MYKKQVYSTGVHKTSLQYMYTQNLIRLHFLNPLQVNLSAKPIYWINVQKTSLQYRCTQNQFIVQVYTKPVYSTCIHKTWLEYTF